MQEAFFFVSVGGISASIALAAAETVTDAMVISEATARDLGCRRVPQAALVAFSWRREKGEGMEPGLSDHAAGILVKEALLKYEGSYTFLYNMILTMQRAGNISNKSNK